jgi:WD40 repeat protein
MVQPVTFGLPLSSQTHQIEPAFLSKDSLKLIFKNFLDETDLLHAGLACREWNSICLNDVHSDIWASLVARRFPRLPPLNPKTDFKALCKLARAIQGPHFKTITSPGFKGISCMVTTNTLLCLGSEKGEVRVWDPIENKELSCFNTEHYVRTLMANDLYLCAGTEGLKIHVWNLKTGECRELPWRFRDPVDSFCLTDDHFLCSRSYIGEISISNLQAEHEPPPVQYPHSAASLVGRGRYAYMGEWGGFVCAWEPDTGTALYRIRPNRQLVTCLKATDDLLLLGSSGGPINVIDRHTGASRLSQLAHHHHSITDLHAQGDNLYATSRDGTATICDLLTGHLLHKLAPDGASTRNPLRRIDVQGDIVVTGAENGTVTIWDGKNGLELRSLRPFNNNPVTYLKLNGNRIYAGFLNGKIAIWEFQLS